MAQTFAEACGAKFCVFLSVCKYFSRKGAKFRKVCVGWSHTEDTENTEYCSAGCRFFSTDYTDFFHAEKINFHAEKIIFYAEKIKLSGFLMYGKSIVQKNYTYLLVLLSSKISLIF
jgi:hypothetical protein